MDFTWTILQKLCSSIPDLPKEIFKYCYILLVVVYVCLCQLALFRCPTPLFLPCLKVPPLALAFYMVLYITFI